MDNHAHLSSPLIPADPVRTNCTRTYKAVVRNSDDGIPLPCPALREAEIKGKSAGNQQDAESPSLAYQPVIREQGYWASPTAATPITRIETERSSVIKVLPSDGIAVTEPNPMQEAEVSWNQFLSRPWSHLWKGVLGWGALICLGLAFLMLYKPSTHWLYTVAMSLLVPATMVTFFCELDVTHRVSGWVALLVAVICGPVSSELAAVSNHAVGATECAALAGLTEEPIKGAFVLFLALFPKRFPSVLSGLALGVSVGAGFAVVETFEYAYFYGTAGAPSTIVLLIRGLFSPLMHMGWTGALGGAIWTARGPTNSGWYALHSWVVWTILAGMIGCHCIWNWLGEVSYLSLALWVLLFYYVKQGIAHMKTKNVSMEGSDL